MSTKTALSPMPAIVPGRGSIWQHSKGDFYRVVTVGRHSENPDQWIVVYEPIFNTDADPAWIRSLILTPENQWPGFLDMRPEDGGPWHRFRHVSGPRTWKEGSSGNSYLGALAVLMNEANRLDAKGEGDPSFSLDDNPKYRVVTRIVRAACQTMFDVDAPEPIEPVDDDDAAGLRQILEVIRFEAQNPPDADRQARILDYAERGLGLRQAS